RFDFPGLASLLEFDDDFIFYKAEIEFHPVFASNSQVDYPEEIIFYTTNKLNGLVSEITASDGSTTEADFYYDELYDENTYYSFDVTEFITDELNDAYYDPDCGLILFMPEEIYQGSLERLVISGSSNSTLRPRLKVYFLFYE
ncbi:MAG: hypothetical protein JXR31_16210, partial [Prolixibacteraceae bacterium]|nr:hypothetical protein [Prolixibacteraceae bacterium]